MSSINPLPFVYCISLIIDIRAKYYYVCFVELLGFNINLVCIKILIIEIVDKINIK